jgi:ATP-dependent DNA helicase RecG
MISGIGPKTTEKLKKLGIETTKDLLFHFPHRYLDFSNIKKIAHIYANSSVTVKGKVISFQNIYTKTGKNLQKALITDNTGSITLLWFNQPYLSTIIKVGEELTAAGTVSLFQNKPTMLSPEHGYYNTGKIIAIYPETKGLSSKWFRKTIQANISFLTKDVNDPLPLAVIKKNKLLFLQNALNQIHCPQNLNILDQARFRLAINEILSIQALSYLQKKEWLTSKPNIILKNKSTTSLIKKLPFSLTPDQKKVWQNIKKDLLSTDKPMNRLLQGDVGSGKTVVALLGASITSQNNSKTIFLAPTEILARQHYNTFKNYLSNVFFLSNQSKLDLKKLPPNAIIISTHAIIYKKNIKDIAFLVIDEQHKFGVKQRSFLASTNPPHTLTMTATPIPRTISLTFLGNLDLSVIKTMPKNRIPIKTFVVPNNKKSDCNHWLEKHLKETKEQAFVVCPFIEQSETLATVKSAKEEFSKLKRIFPNLKLALIHGKIKSEERQKILKDFKENKINILVTTPIIEVGIDFPNCTTMIILSADRFGLAQLHQLRGRVGRGDKQSFCFLFSESNNEKSQKRLDFLAKNASGQKIAEFDLKTRGPGEIFSTIQHGFPSLKLADISDTKLIESSQKILKEILDSQPTFDLNKLIQINSPFPNQCLS